MFFPVGDDNSDRHSTPIVTWSIIALNILVFVFLQGCGSNLEFTYAFSTVPGEIVTGQDLITPGRMVQDPSTGYTVELPGLGVTPLTVYLTLLTSMFMHGGLGHIFGNMMFLVVFGDNVENALGRGRFLLFYLLTGVAAALTHIAATYAFDGDPLVPMLGASGAISGVLGGYLLLFPGRRVRVVVLYMLQDVPAIVAIGLWFLFQIINGLGMLGGQGGGGGIRRAHWRVHCRTRAREALCRGAGSCAGVSGGVWSAAGEVNGLRPVARRVRVHA